MRERELNQEIPTWFCQKGSLSNQYLENVCSHFVCLYYSLPSSDFSDGPNSGAWPVRELRTDSARHIFTNLMFSECSGNFEPDNTFSNSDTINTAVITTLIFSTLTYQTSFINILNNIILNNSVVRDLLFDPQLTCVLMFLNFSTYSLFGYFYQWGYWAIMVTYII